MTHIVWLMKYHVGCKQGKVKCPVLSWQWVCGVGYTWYFIVQRTFTHRICRVIKMLLCNLDDSGKFHLKRLACDKVDLWSLFVWEFGKLLVSIGYWHSLGDDGHEVGCPWLLVDLVTHQPISCERVFRGN